MLKSLGNIFKIPDLNKKVLFTLFIVIIISAVSNSPILSYFIIAIFTYLAMVEAHLLGRFYYLNSRKLNWEV